LGFSFFEIPSPAKLIDDDLLVNDFIEIPTAEDIYITLNTIRKVFSANKSDDDESAESSDEIDDV